MNEQRFTQLLGGIDPALIARAEESVPMRKKPSFRITLVATIAALLALSLLLGAAAIAFIPKTYDLDYEIPKQENASKVTQIYYLSENGKIKRQSVLLPPTEQNVFLTWKHLNGLGDEVQMLDVVYEDVANWSGSYITVQLSTALRNHPNSEALLDSLQKTLARSFGVMKQNVSFAFHDPVTLEFSHDLTETPVRLKSGDLFTVTVTMTNVSNEDIVYEGSYSEFIPKAKLLAKSNIYVATEIFPELHESTGEIAEYRLAPGESKSFTYTFRIPYATSSYIITGHDLTVWFGEQSKTFENVITVIYAYAAKGAKSAFKDFTLAHTSEDRTELQSIWDSYSYQGKNIMEQMIESSGEGNMDGTPFEIEHGNVTRGEQTLFSYTKDTRQFQYGWFEFYNYSFTATVLPDGITLPMGITEQDSILEALIKLGIDDQTASDYLAQEGVIILAGPFTTSSVIEEYSGTIELVCNQTGYTIVYTCQKGIIAQDDPYPHATRSFSLHYALDSQRFLCICLNVDLPTRPNVIFDALPTFTEVDGKETSITLTQEQADALHQAMNKGKWQSYKADAEYDCQGMIGQIEFEYASATGHLTVGGFTVTLSGKDRIDLNQILGIPLTLE